MNRIKSYCEANFTRLIGAVLVMGLLAVGAIDPGTAVMGAVLLEAAPTDLKAMEKAMADAFAKMQDNLKATQDTADKALDESKKLGGVIEAKTADMLKQLGEKSAALAADFAGTRAEVLELAQKLATKPGGDGNPGAQKSLYDIIVASPEWEACSKRASAKTMDPVTVGSFHKTQIVNAQGASQPLVPAQRLDGVIFPAEQRLFVRDLLPQARTSSNLIEFALEASYTNNAGQQGGGSPAAGEGELLPESAMTFTLSNAAVVTIGHWIPASRQVLQDASMLAGHISGRLSYGLKLVEETQIVTGNGATGTISGLNNQATAYSRGATNDTILDTLLKAMLQVSLSNYEVSAYVLNPVDWFGAMLLKDSQNRYLFSDPQAMVAPRVWGKPVVASASMTQGKFLAGSFALAAQIWDREDATVRISENVNDHFIRNMVAILAEERMALTVYRPAAFVYGNTSHAG